MKKEVECCDYCICQKVTRLATAECCLCGKKICEGHMTYLNLKILTYGGNYAEKSNSVCLECIEKGAISMPQLMQDYCSQDVQKANKIIIDSIKKALMAKKISNGSKYEGKNES